MSTQDNKAIAQQFCERLSAADIPGTLALMTDDVNYWILGRQDILRSSGPHTKAQMERIFTIMHEQLKSGMKFTAKSLIAEGDELALEAESLGELKNGRIYNNQYCIRLKIRDGKIAEAREYLDTQHVHAVWYA
jgi:ketosteroid isomerase-like protein